MSMDNTNRYDAVEKDVEDKIKDIKIIIEDAVEEETRKLGKYLIDLMKSDTLDGADIEAGEEGYGWLVV